MSRWIAYRRCNELDQPTPKVIAHEWIVSTDPPGHGRLSAAFPDTNEGQLAAREIANQLNYQWTEGMREAQHNMKVAIGMISE